MTETIVAAAIRFPVPEEFTKVFYDGKRTYPDYLIISSPPPARHHTLLQPTTVATDVRVGPDNQGFLTSTGRYVNRKEAYQIVVASGQLIIKHSSNIPGTLYSEDLW